MQINNKVVNTAKYMLGSKTSRQSDHLHLSHYVNQFSKYDLDSWESAALYRNKRLQAMNE